MAEPGPGGDRPGPTIRAATPSLSTLSFSAPAKVNLYLHVTGRRADGYHELDSLIAFAGVGDTVTVWPADDLSLAVDGPFADRLPPAPDNLVLKAARLLKGELAVGAGVRICLEKRIPTSAGLGGGSSDAAATLKALNILWGLGLDIDELLPLASRLGSDVPFFLRGGTAVAEGRGEVLIPLPPSAEQWLILAVPHQALENKTAVLYAALKPSDYSDGSRTASMTEVIRRGGSIGAALTYNVFEAVAFGNVVYETNSGSAPQPSLMMPSPSSSSWLEHSPATKFSGGEVVLSPVPLPICISQAIPAG